MRFTRARHQKGSLTKMKRKSGLEVWLFRWRERQTDGSLKPRKLVVGTVRELRTEAAARRAVEALRPDINRDHAPGARPPRTFGALVEHYRAHELAESPTGACLAFSTRQIYRVNLAHWIVPRWGSVELADFEAGGTAVHVEQWLAGLRREDGRPLTNGTKAKLRNIMSAVCTHAMRWGWLRANPVAMMRQSARRTLVRVPLTVAELQALYTELQQRERTLLVLDVPTGMRFGELLALQWSDLDWEDRVVHVRKAVWHQRLGPVKTAASERTMPLTGGMVEELQAWRRETPCAKDSDWVFASLRRKGAQPYWPDPLMKRFVRPAAGWAGITKHVSWHVFRHTFSTLLVANGEDVKTVQSLLRHANPNVTLGLYTHGIDERKRAAQERVVEMIRPEGAEGGLDTAVA